MFPVKSPWIMVAVVCMGACAWNLGGPKAVADEQDKRPTRVSRPKSGDKKPAATVVDDGTPKEMLAQLYQVIALGNIKAGSREEFITLRIARLDAGEAGAKKILAHPDTTDDQAKAAAKILLQIQGNRIALNVGGAEARSVEVLKELEADPRAVVKEVAAARALELKIAALPTLPPQDLERVTRELLNDVKTTNYKSSAVAAAIRAASVLERSEQGEKAAAYYEDLITLLKEAPDADTQSQAADLEGTLRKLRLLGHTMEVKGVTVDGKPFDLAELKGKVVLVDFWATWCGPCVGEIPNVRKMYAAYHDKGFEVVGISLDNDRSALETFIREKELPWTNLFVSKEDEEKNAGWKNPLARQYGVNSIPCCILVGADGKVLSISARGPILEQQLLKIYGPVPETVKDVKSEE